MRRHSGRGERRRRLGALDRQLLATVTAHRTPAADRLMTAASAAADRSAVWLATAGALAVTGRRRPRSAAAAGILGIGIASTIANGPLKFAWRRDRPPDAHDGTTLLPLPRTFSFPSGHSASAFAFAAGAGAAWPATLPVLLPAAAVVAYSRAYTGVHYPSDVVAGAALGTVSGAVAARAVAAARTRSVHRLDSQPLDMAVPRRVLLLVSPKAGSAGGLEAGLQALRHLGVTVVERVETPDFAHVRDLLGAAEGELPMVVAAGGDGTVGAAVNAIDGTGAVLGILPLGTSNDVARSLGIPPHPAEAAQVLAGGVVRRVSAGALRLDDGETRLFANTATVGLNVEFAQQATRGSMRARFGRLAYPVSAAIALRRYRPFRCTITVDGRQQTFDVVHLSANNATVFGGVVGMRVPHATMTDDKLDIIIVERLSPGRLAQAVANDLVGRHRPVRHVHGLQVDSIRVIADSPQQVAADGEVVGKLPATFEIRPDAIRVVTPR